MSGGNASGVTTDASDATDDEDSESSSGSPTPHGSADEHTLEKFYRDWRREVTEKLILRSREQRSDNRDETEHMLRPSAEEFSPHTYIPLDNLDVPSLDESVSDEHFEDLPSAVLKPERELHTQTHISVLPHEVLLHIFRWVVGSHLDIRMLGKLASVCRGFYLLSHDPSIWRSICLRLWPPLVDRHGLGVKGDQLPAEVPQHYGYRDWRDMAIRKPHVLLDGCYLCRISYVRPGEALSGIYRPMHLVVYYRGIRFYPDGQVKMLTSYHPPNAVVAALGKQHVLAQVDNSAVLSNVDSDSTGTSQESVITSGGGLLQGTYVQVDPDVILCTLFRPRCKEKPNPFRRRKQTQLLTAEQQITYNIRFKLSSSKRRLHNVLRWDSYTIHQLNTTTQTDQLITLNVFSDQFPECRFSPVRSYMNTVAPEPL